MAAIEIGQFDIMLADVIIGRLQTDGIAAFPLPSGGAYGRRMAGILVEEEDAEAARKIIAAGEADLSE